MALGREDGEAEFFVSKSPTWGRLAQAGTTPRQSASIRVPVRSLDSLAVGGDLSPPNSLKWTSRARKRTSSRGPEPPRRRPTGPGRRTPSYLSGRCGLPERPGLRHSTPYGDRDRHVDGRRVSGSRLPSRAAGRRSHVGGTSRRPDGVLMTHGASCFPRPFLCGHGQ